jgi:hypothetical protein
MRGASQFDRRNAPVFFAARLAYRSLRASTLALASALVPSQLLVQPIALLALDVAYLLTVHQRRPFRHPALAFNALLMGSCRALSALLLLLGALQVSPTPRMTAAGPSPSLARVTSGPSPPLAQVTSEPSSPLAQVAPGSLSHSASPPHL